MTPIRHHACAAAAALLCLIGIAAAQEPPIDWSGVSESLTDQDKRNIVRLARDLGIATVQKVGDNRGQPCALLFVVSAPVVDGNRVRRTTATMRRTDGGCRAIPSPRRSRQYENWKTSRRGNWLATQYDSFDGNSLYSSPTRWTGCRIRDGSWHVDVSLGADATYEDAETIVRALHRGTFIDRRNADNRLDFANVKVDRIGRDTILLWLALVTVSVLGILCIGLLIRLLMA